ncbi:MAG: hypothetical protein AAGC93_12725 [Cyanobacteria bacterium P01_F01_bin.53]
MAEQNGGIVLSNLDALSFDSFGRDPNRDIVCVSPVRTMVRREEEIVLIRRVRKVEEVDASPTCPVGSTQMSKVQQEGEVSYQA